MHIIIVGLGKTGRSCVAYLSRQPTLQPPHQDGAIKLSVFDTRSRVPDSEVFQAAHPDVDFYFEHLPDTVIDACDSVIVSPGVSLSHPSLHYARQHGKRVMGDVAFFLQQTQQPVLAITGSNGKSTVTAWTGAVLQALGVAAAVGGNIGTPVCDLLLAQKDAETDAPAWWVLELSSFQCETLQDLGAHAATVLNLSPDHLDRHGSFDAYAAAKRRIYQGCRYCVLTVAEPDTWPDTFPQALLAGCQDDVVLVDCKAASITHRYAVNDTALCRDGVPVLSVSDLPLQQAHNCRNALTVLACVDAADQFPASTESLASAMQSFQGLPHRCELVREADGVCWVNDSKGTNVGAAATALQTYGDTKAPRLLWIAGGELKEDDLSPLVPLVQQHVKHMLLIGRDADRLADGLSGCAADMQRCGTIEKAVDMARRLAQPGDVVLLSPACASFDQFDNFEQRGDVFRALAQANQS